jgi:hypothetical protein
VFTLLASHFSVRVQVQFSSSRFVVRSSRFGVRGSRFEVLALDATIEPEHELSVNTNREVSSEKGELLFVVRRS